MLTLVFAAILIAAPTRLIDLKVGASYQWEFTSTSYSPPVHTGFSASGTNKVGYIIWRVVDSTSRNDSTIWRLTASENWKQINNFYQNEISIPSSDSIIDSCLDSAEIATPKAFEDLTWNRFFRNECSGEFRSLQKLSYNKDSTTLSCIGPAGCMENYQFSKNGFDWNLNTSTDVIGGFGRFIDSRGWDSGNGHMVASQIPNTKTENAYELLNHDEITYRSFNFDSLFLFGKTSSSIAPKANPIRSWMTGYEEFLIWKNRLPAKICLTAVDPSGRHYDPTHPFPTGIFLIHVVFIDGTSTHAIVFQP